jgi:hypothetical protein
MYFDFRVISQRSNFQTIDAGLDVCSLRPIKCLHFDSWFDYLNFDQIYNKNINIYHTKYLCHKNLYVYHTKYFITNLMKVLKTFTPSGSILKVV